MVQISQRCSNAWGVFVYIRSLSKYTNGKITALHETLNADVWKDFGNIIEYDATGIDKVTNRSDVKEISRYSLNGQRVTSPTKGMNIVIYSDGSIKKVVVQ